MHSQESVFSPRVRFYGTGTELLVVRRERGWFQVSDPVTLERGRVFEKYLSPIAGSSLTQTATQSTAEPLPAKNDSTKIKKAEPIRISNDVMLATSDPQSSRLTSPCEQRRGFGLFMFGRFAAR
jgi:hypothetical protein